MWGFSGGVYPIRHTVAGEAESAESSQCQNREGGDTRKGAVHLEDTFRGTRSRELEHEYQPPFVETEFATSRSGGSEGV